MKFTDVHTHTKEALPDRIAIVNLFPGQVPAPASAERSELFYSAGLHPWHLSENTLSADINALGDTLEANECVAVGETGLDRACAVPFDLQRRAFDEQIKIAVRKCLPLIIHCVRAYPDVISFRRKYDGTPVPWIVHGFRGNSETAAQLLAHNIILSFGSAVLENNPKTEKALIEIPDDMFLLESDESGRDIREIYEKVAEIKGISVDKLAGQIFGNFHRNFGVGSYE